MKKFFSLLLCGAMLVSFSACEQNNEVNGEGGGSHEYVDLGLPSGTLWATCNVGATAPEQSGNYFAWGETKTKQSYSYTNYKWYNWDEGREYFDITKYLEDDCDAEGDVDHLTTLTLEDDAAHVNWGGDWRMPTSDELKELIDKCEWQWTTLNGIYGYNVKGETGKSIFLPAAGNLWYEENETIEEYGFYMSNELQIGECAYCQVIKFKEDVWYGLGEDGKRWLGMSVRPVMSKK